MQSPKDFRNKVASSCYTLVYSLLLQSVCQIKWIHATTSNENNNALFRKAILYDIFPKSSNRCSSHNDDDDDAATSSTVIDHTFTPSTSSHWNPQHAPFEEHAFLLKMIHKQGGEEGTDNPSQGWTLRLSQGGNIYSFVGTFGESVPPQYPPDSPWMDEVWQTVAVNLESGGNRNYPYYIHQAGTYLKDDVLAGKPFYSPSLGVYCEQNVCYTAAWGQNAHVPTIHTSPALYMNRYVDCGNGVLEVTSLIHNMKSNNPQKLPFNWMNVPWGGFRTSTLPDVYMSNPNGSPSILQKPLQNFGGKVSASPVLSSTGGYSIFAEAVAAASDTGFDLPCGDGSGKQVDCLKPPPKPNNSTSGQTQCSGSGEGADNMATNSLNVESRSTCRANEAKTGVQRLELVVAQNNPCKTSVNHHKIPGNNVLYFVLKPTITIGCGYYDGKKPLLFTSSRTGVSFPVKSVMHWSWKGTHLFFNPVDGQLTSEDVNTNFAEGNSITVSYAGEGKQFEESLALSFVHGTDRNGKEVIEKDWLRAPSGIRYGDTGQGARDYTVFTVIAPVTINSGETFVKRQYMITDLLQNMDGKSSDWVGEVEQNLFTQEELLYDGQVVYIFSSLSEGEKDDDNDDAGGSKVFGAALHEDSCVDVDDKDAVLVHCKGSTVPKVDAVALFFIDCGGDYYVGSDLYHFASRVALGDDTILRPYVCESKDAVEGSRPSFKLLGYFEEGSCDSIKNGFLYNEDLYVTSEEYDPRGHDEL